MKPIYMEFCGINSFSEKAEINFTRLLQSGLFGIFGDTGSGKSTILDGINFALFGTIARANTNAEFININCNEAFVNFDFEISGKDKKHYRVERKIRRKNSFQKVELLEISDENKFVVCEGTDKCNAKIIEIVGLNATDFKRCIAIPQGDFAQFVKESPTERNKLIERLFDLGKYGKNLTEKLKAKKFEANNAQKNICDELEKHYLDVSDEIICDLKSKQKEYVALKASYEKDFQKNLKIYNDYLKLFENKTKYDDVIKKLSELKEKSIEIENIKQNLDLLPTAQKIIEDSSEITVKQEKLLNLNKDLSNCEENYKQVLEQLNACDVTVYDKELEELKAIKGKAELLLEDEKNLNDYKNERENLLKDYKIQKEKLNLTELKLKEARTDKDLKTTKLNTLGEIKLEDYLDENFKSGLLYSQNKEWLDYFLKIDAEIKSFDDNGKFYKFIENELAKNIEKLNNKLSCKNESYDLLSSLNNYKQKLTEFQSLKDEISESEKLIAEYFAKIENLKSILAEIESKGQKIKRQIEEISKKITSVLGENLSVVDKINEIDKDYFNKSKQKEQLTLKKKNLDDNIIKFTADIASIKQKIKNENQSILLLQDSLNLCFKNPIIKDVFKAKSVLNIVIDKELAEKKVKNYENELNLFQNKKFELEKNENLLNANENTLNEYCDSYKNSENLKNETATQIALIENQLSNFEVKLEQKKKIEAELKIVKKQVDLLSKLDGLFKNSKFLDFVADEYLCEISQSASKMLLNLTDGRYYLIYNGNFYVGDNRNGGALRSTATLSGGETFLVSLSLAISLSSAICAKSLKPVEFFFLDEGFGTLDSHLVDVVMDSLEKLKDDFCIGLISHVEELKHRISNKITVKGATEERGSIVSFAE